MPATLSAPVRRRSRQVKTEPFRILVASDAEPASAGALRVAAALARRRSATVHALIVATPFPHTFPSVFAVAPPAMVDDDNRRSALEQLRGQLSTVRGTGGWTIRATTGFTAGAIVGAGARWPASLIVLGTGDHGIAGRIIGSETAVNVATHARVAAATLAATMLGPNGTLTLMYASPLIAAESTTGTLTDLYTTGARDRLADIATDIHRRTKRTVLSEVASGGIVDRLLEAADEQQCDLIALGGHEPTFLERLLAGRVRADVLRRAACSVLVVPSPERA